MKKHIAQTYFKHTQESRKTGKEYSKWSFSGWGILPHENGRPYAFKGQYLVIGRERYDISSIKMEDRNARGFFEEWATNTKDVKSVLEDLGYTVPENFTV